MKKIILIAFLFVSMFASANDTTVVNLQVGAGNKFATITVVDEITGDAIPSTVTNVIVQNNNPELATIILTASPGVIKATGLAAGSGAAVVSCNVSYVDPGDGLQKNESKTIVIKYTVIGAPHGVKLSLVFN